MELATTEDETKSCVNHVQSLVTGIITRNARKIRIVAGSVFLLAFGSYVAYALYYSVEKNIALLVLCGLTVLLCVAYLLRPTLSRRLRLNLTEPQRRTKRRGKR